MPRPGDRIASARARAPDAVEAPTRRGRGTSRARGDDEALLSRRGRRRKIGAVGAGGCWPPGHEHRAPTRRRRCRRQSRARLERLSSMGARMRRCTAAEEKTTLSACGESSGSSNARRKGPSPLLLARAHGFRPLFLSLALPFRAFGESTTTPLQAGRRNRRLSLRGERFFGGQAATAALCGKPQSNPRRRRLWPSCAARPCP